MFKNFDRRIYGENGLIQISHPYFSQPKKYKNSFSRVVCAPCPLLRLLIPTVVPIQFHFVYSSLCCCTCFFTPFLPIVMILNQVYTLSNFSSTED